MGVLDAQYRRRQLENQTKLAQQNEKIIKQQQALLEESKLTDDEKKERNLQKKMEKEREGRILLALCLNCKYKFKGDLELESRYCPNCGQLLEKEQYNYNILSKIRLKRTEMFNLIRERDNLSRFKKSDRIKEEELQKQIDKLAKEVDLLTAKKL